MAEDRKDPAYILGSASLGFRPSVHILPTLEDFELGAAQVGSALWRAAESDLER